MTGAALCSSIFWFFVIVIAVSAILSALIPEDSHNPEAHEEIHKIAIDACWKAQALSEGFLRAAIDLLKEKRR